MSKQAVNIALIPENDMCCRVLELNRHLVSKGSDLVLGLESSPHITLVQGVLDENELDDACSALENIAGETPSLNLTANEIYVGPMSGSIWLKIKKGGIIDNLHKRAWSELEPILTFYADKNMFVKPDEIHEEVSWIKNFPLKSVWDQYKPHITLGFGNKESIEINLPIIFRADKLAIYQMGKYCSCSREIKTYTLK